MFHIHTFGLERASYRNGGSPLTGSFKDEPSRVLGGVLHENTNCLGTNSLVDDRLPLRCCESSHEALDPRQGLHHGRSSCRGSLKFGTSRDGQANPC